MENKKIVVRVGSKGRVSIPPQALEQSGINEGDIVLLDIEKATVTREAKDERD